MKTFCQAGEKQITKTVLCPVSQLANVEQYQQKIVVSLSSNKTSVTLILRQK